MYDWPQETNSVLLQTLIKSPILVLFIYGSYLKTETGGYQAEYAHLSFHFDYVLHLR